jgi:hypothetical protein
MYVPIKSKTQLWRVYKSNAARKSALTQMLRRRRYNYFVCYKDVKGPAINAANVTWLAPGNVWVDR